MRKATLLIGLFLLALTGCGNIHEEVPTSVKVGSGPSFSFHGSGRLASFTVYAPLSGQRIAAQRAEVASVGWQVVASKGYFEGTRVENLQLTYGKVPDGYVQTVPSGARAAPPLPAGVIYSFFADTTGAAIATGYFYVGKSGAIQVEVPDLCLTMVGGHWVRVKCGWVGSPSGGLTTEPYKEPTDLEKYAREHRVCFARPPSGLGPCE